jgi:hypothetical protein
MYAPSLEMSCVTKGWSPLEQTRKEVLQSAKIREVVRMYAHRSRDVKVNKETTKVSLPQAII